MRRPAPAEEPVFVAKSVPGKEPAAIPKPKSKNAFPIKLISILGGAAFGVAALGCLGCLLMFWPSPDKKKGSIVITEQTKFANPNNVAKPGTNRVLVYIRRIDFSGPVIVTLEDLPEGVTVTKATIPAKDHAIDLKFTVSHGTPPQVKKIRLVAMYEPVNISDEMPLTLTIIEDSGNKLKK